MSANDELHDDGLNALLVKEMEETNDWARLGAQLYFGWFTLLLTVNGVATGWLFTRTGTMPQFAWLVFCVFILLNLMGTIATFRIRSHLLDSDRRIRDVIEELTQHSATKGPSFRPRSPVPLGAINTAFGATGTALIMLALFWAIFAIFGSRLGAR
jgi:hypothetical protein